MTAVIPTIDNVIGSELIPNRTHWFINSLKSICKVKIYFNVPSPLLTILPNVVKKSTIWTKNILKILYVVDCRKYCLNVTIP